jgi:prohibitin 2
MKQYRRQEIFISPKTVTALIVVALLIFLLILGGSQMTQVVEPGNRGVRVTLGKVSPNFEQEGFLVKPPFITSIHQVSIRQQTEELKMECYSADLQQVKASLRILYRIPESSVVAVFQQYEGNASPNVIFSTLIAPRVVEAWKEVASTQSAEMIVQNREKIKVETLAAIREKIGNGPGGGPLLNIEDITLSDLALSAELNTAIEQKMTQREEAERAKFVQRQAEIEAETAIIKARGEGEAIQIRGKALRESPAFVRWQIVEKWDGVSPLVVGGETDQGANVIVSMDQLEQKK